MNATEATAKITKQIAAELEMDSPDRLLIARLSHQLLDLDSSTVRFTVDATHVQRLGRELVAKQETALAELIKNSYDADATLVLIDIDPPKKGSVGSIVIADDGIGMSMGDIKNGWMRLSTDSKVDVPVSTTYGRLRAGRKGIGRFAVERLGKRLELTTRRRGEAVGYSIVFNWDETFRRGIELSFVTHQVEEFPKELQDQGTTLKIVDLRDKWPPDSIRMAWKMLFQLQSPVLGATTASVPAYPVDPGFQVFIDSQDARGAKINLSLETEFSKLAIATIHGELAADGTVTYTLDSSKLNHHEKDSLVVQGLAGLGPVKMEAYYLIFDQRWMPGANVKQATNLAREMGGIKLYRNGFRVSPYGDQGDDWLNLANETARRTILVPANNSNFVGQVHVTAEHNPGLEETASREGLLEGPDYAKLVLFVHDCLWWAARRIGSIRERKVFANQKDYGKRDSASLHVRVSQLVERLRNAKSAADSDAAIEEILSVASDYEHKFQAEREESLKYEAMLRVLASLGLSIAVFSHEVAGSTASLQAAVDNLLLFLEGVDPSIQVEAKIEAGQVAAASGRISELGGYLGSLTTQSESRNLRTLVVSTVCETFEHQFKSYSVGRGIALVVRPIDNLLRTCPMHRSEFDSILFNFFSNSIKAIKRARPLKPQILLTASEERRFIVLRFQDNGDGVKHEHRERIFDAFFTTSGGQDDEEGSGTGLGLRIVSDIASSYGGNVKLAEPDEGYFTAFEFRLPKFDPAKHTL